MLQPIQGGSPTNWSHRAVVGGQTIARREVVRLLGIASVAATFPGFRQWAFAGITPESTSTGTVAAVESAYRPLFFTATQYRLVEHLAEAIIPDDDTAGAKRAGVGEFIDFMVANRVPVSGSGHSDAPRDSALSMGSELQRQWLDGLAWLDGHCTYAYGRVFLDCDASQQHELLSALAYKAKFTSATEPGREFFQLIRDYTVAGYYTSRVGLEALGFPGLQSVWTQPPGCSHLDDPEHLRLHAS